MHKTMYTIIIMYKKGALCAEEANNRNYKLVGNCVLDSVFSWNNYDRSFIPRTLYTSFRVLTYQREFACCTYLFTLVKLLRVFYWIF